MGLVLMFVELDEATMEKEMLTRDYDDDAAGLQASTSMVDMGSKLRWPFCWPKRW